MQLDYSALGLSPTTLSRLVGLAGRDADSPPAATFRQRVRRASIPEADAARIRIANSAAHELARSSQTEADATRIRIANSAAHERARSSQTQADATRIRIANSAAHERARSSQTQADAARIRIADSAAHERTRSSQTQADAARIRSANSASHVRARVQLRNSAADAADHIASTLLDSFNFDEVQIEYIVNNFERSPAAALAFTTANTGICKKPADLGPLLDGVPDSIVEGCVQRFKTNTDLACIHACACCGLRTNDCKLISVDQMAPYAMTPAEVDVFALENATLQQVRSTCLLRGVRYWMHPELVNLDSGTAWRCAACTNSKGHVHPIYK
jgi:hypothetical protein